MEKTLRGARRRARTNNQKSVLDALRDAERPLTAYDLIDVLRDQGITSPPTVYRALGRLTDDGLVHRLESLNAFVACRSGGGHEEAAIFTICTECGVAAEITDAPTTAGLYQRAKELNFRIATITCELRGTCDKCREAGGPN